MWLIFNFFRTEQGTFWANVAHVQFLKMFCLPLLANTLLHAQSWDDTSFGWGGKLKFGSECWQEIGAQLRDSRGHKINDHVSRSRTAGTPEGLWPWGREWGVSPDIDGTIKSEEALRWIQRQTGRWLGERGVGDVRQKQWGARDVGGFGVDNWTCFEVLVKRMEVGLDWSEFGTRAQGTGVAGLRTQAPSGKGLGAVSCEALWDTRVLGITNSLHLGIFNGDADLGGSAVLSSTHSLCCLSCLMRRQSVWAQAPEAACRLELCYFSLQAFIQQ